MNDKYLKYIDYTRPKSKREKMPLTNRAAQFMSFDALEGHKSYMEDKTRYILDKPILSEEHIEKISNILDGYKREKVCITIYEYFDIEKIKDIKIDKINSYEKYIILSNGKRVSFDNILDIDIDKMLK